MGKIKKITGIGISASAIVLAGASLDAEETKTKDEISGSFEKTKIGKIIIKPAKEKRGFRDPGNEKRRKLPPIGEEVEFER